MAGGMCPACVLGEVVVQLDRLMIPVEARCKECGHTFDPIEEMNQWKA